MSNMRKILFLPFSTALLDASRMPSGISLLSESTSPYVPYQRQRSASQAKLVLVIDDSATMRKIVETCLHRQGFQVTGFADGVEALRWLTAAQAPLPDLILLDIVLPQMDGFEVALHFKAIPKLSATVLVMLSRHDGLLERLKARLVGARAYITKPFKTQEIISVVESYLGTPQRP